MASKSPWSKFFPRTATSKNVEENDLQQNISLPTNGAPPKPRPKSVGQMFQCGATHFKHEMFESDIMSDSEIPIAKPVSLQNYYANLPDERREVVNGPVRIGIGKSSTMLKEETEIHIDLDKQDTGLSFIEIPETDVGRKEVEVFEPSIAKKENLLLVEGSRRSTSEDSDSSEKPSPSQSGKLKKDSQIDFHVVSRDRKAVFDHQRGNKIFSYEGKQNNGPEKVPNRAKISLDLANEIQKLDVGGGERRAISMDTGPDKGLRLSHIVREHHMDVTALFKFDKELGRGASGTVRRCFDITTGKPFACKTVMKSSLRCQLDLQDLAAEVKTLTIMQEHPFVVRLRGVFEDSKCVHIVMEYCEGGDLFTRVKQRRYYTEPEAAMICRTLASVLAFAHSKGIIHRDLKPENILVASRDNDIDICLADFGSATFFKPGQKLNQLIGSPLYIAPCVLQHSYGPEADLWSLGIVLYILLCGTPPFWGKSNAEIFRNVQYGKLQMEGGRWDFVSKGAKKLVSRLLNRDVEKRITARQVLKHPWILYHCPEDEEEIQTRTISTVVTFQKKFPVVPIVKPLSPLSTAKRGELPPKTRRSIERRNRPRRHSLGSENSEVSFEEKVKIYGENYDAELRESYGSGSSRYVLCRSPTPFRRSTEIDEESFEPLETLGNDENSKLSPQ